MRTDNGDIPQNQQVLIDDLRILLEKQIESANQGSIKDVEAMASQASLLVKAITEKGIFENPEFQNRRQQLQKLYEDLCLAIATQKAETAQNINLLHKGKKAAKAYHSNI
jgi:hypothetical protein